MTTESDAEVALAAIAFPITWTPDGRDIWPGEYTLVDGVRYIVFKRDEGVFRAGGYGRWFGEFPTLEDAKRAVLVHLIHNKADKL